MSMVLCTSNSCRIGRPKYCLSGNLNTTPVVFYMYVIMFSFYFYPPLNATKAHFEGKNSCWVYILIFLSMNL